MPQTNNTVRDLFERALTGEPAAIDKIQSFLDIAVESYILVPWPESQEYMEKEWFRKEAILALGSEDTTGSSAYFVPIKRIINET